MNQANSIKGIQTFTTPFNNGAFPVDCGSIVAVQPYSNAHGTGALYQGAKSVLLTPAGYAIGVTQDFDTASTMWLKGKEAILSSQVGHA